jgi:hypothetical protein
MDGLMDKMLLCEEYWFRFDGIFEMTYRTGGRGYMNFGTYSVMRLSLVK